MNTLAGRPRLLKQANLSLIRKAIRAKGTATRAEIAHETKISSTTVRSLLSEMMGNGEIESIGYDESSGGRKAERYRFNPDRYFGAAFCISDTEVYALLVNICEEIVETTQLKIPDGDFEAAIIAYLDELVTKREIKSIGLGVPGAVEGGSYWRQNETYDELNRVEVGNHLAERYRIPVVMENDLNATAIGFGRCYVKEFPNERLENVHMAYLYFEKKCVSAGFIAGGRVIRGCRNFAGELGLIPMDNERLLDHYLSEAADDAQYVKLLIHILAWICGVLNPQYIVLGGPDLRKDCIGPVGDGLSALLPKHMFAEILYSEDAWHDFFDGMAHLTAGRMFDDIQVVKE